MEREDETDSDNCQPVGGDCVPTQSVPKKRKKTSDVWNEFTEDHQGNKFCSLCNTKFNSTTSTFSMRYHLQTAHKGGRVGEREKPFEGKKADDLVCEHIVDNGLPLSLVDSAKFRAMISYLRPNYVPPCRRKLTAVLLPDMRKRLEAAMARQLSRIEYYSLAVDSWTSVANLNYLAITCQGITKEWEHEHFLLQVTPVTESETAEFIADTIEEAIDTWGIVKDNILSTTSDGAPNVRCAIESKLGTAWVYCVAHVINRSVYIGLKNGAVASVVRKANEISKLFKRSPKAARLLEEKQKALHLPTKSLKINNKTRWGSAHKMMKRMCASHPAVSACLPLLRGTRRKVPSDLTSEEWDTLASLANALQPFKVATKFLSQQRMPTFGVVSPMMKRLLQHHLQPDENEDEVLRVFKTAVIDDLQTRWTSISEGMPDAVLLSAYLDPRTKDFAFVEDVVLRGTLLNNVRQSARALLMEQESPSRQASAQSMVLDEDKNAAGPSSMDNKLAYLLGEGIMEDAYPDRSEREPANIELHRYDNCLRCPLVNRESDRDTLSDPLMWWKTHSAEYPRVARLARRYLSIASTSVAVERVFSKGGWIVNKRRCSLEDDTVSMLMFLACNQHHLDRNE